MKEKDNDKLPIALIITLVGMVLVIIIFIGWFYWQNNKPEVIEDENTINSELAEEVLIDEQEKPIAEDDPDETTLAGEGNKIYAVREEFYYAVPETEKAVEDSYFDDALFIGDSITTGIPHYLEKEFPDIAVVAERGIHLFNTLTAKKIRTDSNEYKTVLEAVEEYEDINKIYIMLGGNDLGYEEPVFIKGYKDFIDALKLQCPDAEIYLQSIPPVTGTEEQIKNYPNSNNEDIERCNLLIMEIAEEKGVNYLDVAVVFMDEKGNLPEKASPDGVHFVGEYYHSWFDYLKTHTIVE